VLAAVADVRADAAAALAQGVGCDSFSSFEAMCDTVTLDALVVCTPPATHPAICMNGVKRGLHVLCEKPLAIDSTSARGMLAAAGRAGVMLTMASKFRYVEDIARAKALLAAGALGQVLMFKNVFTAWVDMKSRWNANPAMSGGGVLIDNGTHSVDLLRSFFGPLAELQVVEGPRVQDLPVEETVRIFVRTGGGVLGTIDLSWSTRAQQTNYLCVYGDQGTLEIGWKQSRYRSSSDDDWTVFGGGYDKVQAFRRQIDNFAGAIQGTEALVVTPEDALASVEVIEAAYAALRQIRWQPVVPTPLPALARRSKRPAARPELLS
jgi:predicted dehydrogenase